MYEVVGCPDCRSLWIREGEAETAECPRCRRTHEVANLRALAETETARAARDARTRLLAERAGHEPGEVADFSSLDPAAEADVVSDAAYLRAHDIDPELGGDEPEPASSDDCSPRDVVLEAVDTDRKTSRAEILDRVEPADVDATEAEAILGRLADTGYVIKDGESYRRVE